MLNTTLEEFGKILVNELSQRLPEVEIDVQEIQKNNGVILHGMIFKEKVNISPTIYMNSFFEDFKSGHCIDDITETIIKIYNDSKAATSIDIALFTEYENVKEKIICCLVSRDKNKQLLTDVPHVDVLNLSVIFRILVEENECGRATILVHNQQFMQWGVDMSALYQVAKNNTLRLFGVELKRIDEALSEMLESDVSLENIGMEVPMYVLTNRCKWNGASNLLYGDILKEFSDKIESSFYILPSSIHELILLPSTGNINREEIEEMVKEINMVQVAPDEVLSDSVYYYDREKQMIV